MDVLVRAHFLIERADKHHLRSVAAGRGVSMSTLVREAIGLFLTTTSGPDADEVQMRALRSIGSLPDERRDAHGHEGEPELACAPWWWGREEDADRSVSDDDDGDPTPEGS